MAQELRPFDGISVIGTHDFAGFVIDEIAPNVGRVVGRFGEVKNVEPKPVSIINGEVVGAGLVSFGNRVGEVLELNKERDSREGCQQSGREKKRDEEAGFWTRE